MNNKTEQKKYRDTHPEYNKKENKRKIEKYRNKKLHELISEITEKVFNRDRKSIMFDKGTHTICINQVKPCGNCILCKVYYNNG